MKARSFLWLAIFISIFTTNTVHAGGYGRNTRDNWTNDIPTNTEGQVAIGCVSKFGYSQAAGLCIVGTLGTLEVDKCFRDGIGGRGCFGNNNTLLNIISSNLEAAQREPNAFSQSVRATTGISMKDIEEHGPLGGENSDARKVCDGITGIFGGHC